jgi:hypothetical protein
MQQQANANSRVLSIGTMDHYRGRSWASRYWNFGYDRGSIRQKTNSPLLATVVLFKGPE